MKAFPGMQKLRGFLSIGAASELPPPNVASIAEWDLIPLPVFLEDRIREGNSRNQGFSSQTTIKGSLTSRTLSESHPIVIIFEYLGSKIIEKGSFLS